MHIYGNCTDFCKSRHETELTIAAIDFKYHLVNGHNMQVLYDMSGLGFYE